MAKVVLGFRNLNILEKIKQVRQFIAKMTGNANFATPNPTLASVTAAADKLETDSNDAASKRQTAQAATDQQNLSEAELDRLAAALAGYVDGVAKGDETIILSAGMSTKAPGAPIGKLSHTENLSATGGDGEGECDLNWQPMRGAASYTVVKSTTGNVANAADWTPAAVATKARRQ